MGALTFTTAEVQALLDEVDDKDTTVTEDSDALVTSGAVYAVCGDVESVLEALL